MSPPNDKHLSLVRRSSQEGLGGEADGEDWYRQPLQLQRRRESKQRPPTKKSRRTKRLSDGQSKYGGMWVLFAALVRLNLTPHHVSI
jgi:hypothetical protein